MSEHARCCARRLCPVQVVEAVDEGLHARVCFAEAAERESELRGGWGGLVVERGM